MTVLGAAPTTLVEHSETDDGTATQIGLAPIEVITRIGMKPVRSLALYAALLSHRMNGIDHF